ncbi:SH3 domain-containing protein [Alkalinema sp. FACHB-956]|uniref:SH3 domain-containing protein n=1 Tax=Alkalinema sp. FACHB-956 TaxID=2692768 RepID=UPI001685C3D0|nr:SH3 domain-containing protein [Alkalinema sp. FACHB-956]MBD2326817.1 SH3 domain-containing protein [Alkalinema sp. FACHB-956]
MAHHIFHHHRHPRSSDFWIPAFLLGVPTIALLGLLYNQGYWRKNPLATMMNNPRSTQAPALVNRPAGSTAQTSLNPSTTTAPKTLTTSQPTHRTICHAGVNGLNLRQAPGLTTPIAVLPCGQAVSVTGNPVWKQGEQWSPVTYGTRQGWSATRLLQKL